MVNHKNLLNRISGGLLGLMELGFYNYGRAIAKFPFLFILLCLIIAAICGIGLSKFKQETSPFKLWTPEGSEFLKALDWQTEHFPQDLRLNMALYEAENVLSKEVILEMIRVHYAMINTVTHNANWSSICGKVPAIPLAMFGRRKREVRDPEVWESKGADTLIARWRELWRPRARLRKHEARQQEGDHEVRKREAREDRSKTEANTYKAREREVEHKARKCKALNRKTRQVDDEGEGMDWSQVLPRDSYCEFLDSLPEVCFETGLLEVFGFDQEFVASLTQEEIIKEVNEADRSAVTGLPLNVTQYLAQITRDDEGNIVGAKAASHTWFTKVNTGINSTSTLINDAGTGGQVDPATHEWEQEMVQNLLNDTERPSDLKFYLMAASSFGTVSGASIRGDLQYLSLGFAVVFCFVVAMLGRCNMVEARPLLSLLGLSCVGLAIAVSYGLCSAFDVLYGPVNSILPFLLLGLGIDDMFVIVEAWRGLKPDEQILQLPQRVGLALGKAGVAITVTSLTDFLAFAVGSSTTLPALRSFCIYSAVGVAAVYFFQATFFVAWLSLDQRRLEDGRHSVFWCWKISNWRPNSCSQEDLCHGFFSKVYARILLLTPVRIFVLIVTFAIFGVSVWGMTELKQEFDQVWFLPQDSYLFSFFMKQREYYPSSGERGSIYFGNINLVNELPKLQKLSQRLMNTDYVAEVDNWADEFIGYWGDEYDPSIFQDQLSIFLFSTKGSKYRSRNFRFSYAINCTSEAPPVTASSIDFQHRLMESSQEEVVAMEAVRSAVRALNFSGETWVLARAYGGWETNKVIEEELWRNLGVALVVVAIATLVLLASISGALMVVICVVLTLVDVAALMHWWGLTIDTVSCIDMVLAVGLCVDYAAHIAHTFLTLPGTRRDRAAATLATIGPPVLSGGFSTFLAFVFLAGSSSHVFTSFFKIFFGVCVFGLYHGLVFLPVVLSFIGPESHSSSLEQIPQVIQKHHPHTQIPLTSKPKSSVNQNGQQSTLTNGISSPQHKTDKNETNSEMDRNKDKSETDTQVSTLNNNLDKGQDFNMLPLPNTPEDERY